MKQMKIRMTEGFRLSENDIEIVIDLLTTEIELLDEMADSNIDLNNLDKPHTFDETAGFEKTDRMRSLRDFLKGLKIK